MWNSIGSTSVRRTLLSSIYAPIYFNRQPLCHSAGLLFEGKITYFHALSTLICWIAIYPTDKQFLNLTTAIGDLDMITLKKDSRFWRNWVRRNTFEELLIYETVKRCNNSAVTKPTHADTSTTEWSWRRYDISFIIQATACVSTSTELLFFSFIM